MNQFILIFFIVLLVIDRNVFLHINRELYFRVFAPSVAIMLVFSGTFLSLFIFMEDAYRFVALFLLTFALPLYLLRRRDFLNQVVLDGHTEMTECPPVLLCADAIGVCLKWIFVMSGFSMIILQIEQWGQWSISELNEMMLATVLFYVITLSLVYRAVKRFSDKGFWYNLGFHYEKKSFLRVIFIPAVLGFLFSCVSATIVFVRKVQPETPLGEVMESASPSLLVVICFIGLAVVLAPLVEELLFRGYLFHVLDKVKGRKFAIGFVSLSFAVLHMNQYWGDWAAIGMVTLLGFVLTFVRVVSGSTLGSTILHYTYNGGVTIMTFILIAVNNPAYMEYSMRVDQLNFVEKEALLLQNIEDNESFVDAHYQLVSLYIEENVSLDDALVVIDEALEITPEKKLFMDTKATVLEKLKRYEEAIIMRQLILEKDLSERQEEEQREKIAELRQIGKDYTN